MTTPQYGYNPPAPPRQAGVFGTMPGPSTVGPPAPAKPFPSQPQQAGGANGRPRQPNAGGGGGQRQQSPGGYQQFSRFTQNQQTPYNPYEQRVFGDEFLDVANNPYVQNMSAAIGQDFNEEIGRSMSALASPFAGAGGTMGFSGISSAHRNMALDDAGENLSNSISQLYGQQYAQERALQDSANQTWSQRQNALTGATASAYGADVGRDAAIKQARIGASAQIRTANIAAETSLEQARMANALGHTELAGRLMMEYERNKLEAQRIQQQASSGWLGNLNSIFGTFGDYSQTNTGVEGDEIIGAIGGGLGSGGFGPDIPGINGRPDTPRNPDVPNDFVGPPRPGGGRV